MNSFSTKECNVHIERLPRMMAVPVFVTNSNTMSYNMCTHPPLKAETLHQTSDCPHAVIDYSQFMSGNEEDTPPPWKRHTLDLKRTPSSSRITSQNYHTKPSNTPDQSEEGSCQQSLNLPVVKEPKLP